MNPSANAEPDLAANRAGQKNVATTHSVERASRRGNDQDEHQRAQGGGEAGGNVESPCAATSAAGMKKSEPSKHPDHDLERVRLHELRRAKETPIGTTRFVATPNSQRRRTRRASRFRRDAVPSASRSALP